MRRDLEKELLSWKTQKKPMPLLLRGARQVGKTHLVESFGKSSFEEMIQINFEQQPEFCSFFSHLDPERIVKALEIASEKRIIPGKTLIFLDEIQNCPSAIISLRYFKEKIPGLHLIGAGSLLEFTLNEPDFKMPVGRVQFLYLKPLSFAEFLKASKKEILLKHLQEIDIAAESIEPAIHEKLLGLVREYANLGGMPAVLSHYLSNGSLKECQDIQSALLATYRNDFGKYAKYTQHKYLQLMFDKAPGLVAERFKFSKVDPDIASREIGKALDKLVDAGLIYQIHATSASGIPLVSQMNSRKFKLLFLDLGLVKRACHLDLQLLFDEDLMLLNQGALAEQFVGQELLVLEDPHQMSQLFFWIREQRSSSAEVDYLMTFNSHIIPIEVKAGSTGRLKSLKIFMEEKKSPFGVRISSAPLGYRDKILSIPFYLIGELPRLLKTLLREKSS